MKSSPVVKACVAGFTILGLAACTPNQFRDFANQTHPKGDVVTILENQKNVPNVHPPQRLDVVMLLVNTTPIEMKSAATRCDNMGGEPIWWPGNVGIMVCEGVDY
jgi:hypothetical protein